MILKELMEIGRLKESWDGDLEACEEEAYAMHDKGVNFLTIKKELRRKGFQKDLIDNVVSKMQKNAPGNRW